MLYQRFVCRKVLALFALFLSAFFLFTPQVLGEPDKSSHSSHSHEEVIEWICPMQCGDMRFSEPAECPLCGMAVVPHRVRRTAEPSEESLAAQLDEGGFFQSDRLLEEAEVIVDAPTRALMPGVPNYLFYAGCGLVIIIAFLLLFLLGEPRRNMKKTSRRWDYPRWEVTRSMAFKKFVKWRGFQPLVQLPVVVLFVLVIVAGLFGNQDASRNIAPVLTWNIWWMGLIFFAFFAGEIWCTVCPWMAIPDWLQRAMTKIKQNINKQKTARFGLEKKWPRALKNLYPAIGMFIALTWMELAYDAPYRPALTAVLGLSMVAMAGATLFIYERKGFCRYICPVGRVTGTYGTTGMLEIRRKDSLVCKNCQTKDCFHGNDQGLPCPTFEFMGAMNENTYCTMCTECIKTCPHDNVGLYVRAPLADLIGPHRKRKDEAWLVLMIFIITVFHGLAMIPLWTHDIVPPLRDSVETLLGFDAGYLLVFTVAMSGFFAACIGLYLGACAVMKWASGNAFYRLKDYFIAFAYPLLPIALAYHLAHNALHFFYEGSKLVRLVSDPFGWGWNLFGTAQSPLTMVIPIHYLWICQIVLVSAGNLAGIWLVHRATYRMFGNRRQALRAVVPMVVFVAILSVLSLWLLSQPMEMRTA